MKKNISRFVEMKATVIETKGDRTTPPRRTISRLDTDRPSHGCTRQNHPKLTQSRLRCKAARAAVNKHCDEHHCEGSGARPLQQPDTI